LPPGIPVALEIPRAALSKTVAAPERLRLAVQATRRVLQSAYGE
jgi:hypothetical protein